MALTTTERAQVTAYMGRNAYTYDLDRDTLNARMDACTAANETQVRAILAQLAALETQIDTAMLSMGLRRVDEIEWQDGASAQVDALNVRGRQLVTRIEAIFGCPRGVDYFGTRAVNASNSPLALG